MFSFIATCGGRSLPRKYDRLITRAGLAAAMIADDVVELGDVAPHDLHLRAQIVERRGAGVDVHADDFLAARRQQADDPQADEAGAANDKDRHGCFLLLL